MYELLRDEHNKPIVLRRSAPIKSATFASDQPLKTDNRHNYSSKTTTISRRRRKRLPPKIRVIFVPQVPPIGIGCVAPMPCAVPVANPCCNLGIAGYGGFGYGGYSGLGGRCCF
ncbi:unnamed protein product [Rotaria sordida]|uniref:Uncharacterized protein n=1 Tax=Rotaria sordida TaxID=392033 RepID=A0A815ERN2_9BILA|nr:unnamed protein product [Rotaria sordida]CAF1582015.1 unnamed protein product [Rotaria sordida]